MGQLDLLVDALKEEGYTATRVVNEIRFSNSECSGVYRNGRFETRRSSGGAPMDIDSIKQNFSKQVVKKAAKQFGWTVKETGKNKFEIRKRV